MDVKFRCLKCKQKLAVTDDMAGHTIQCPSCTKNILVPLILSRAKKIFERLTNVLDSKKGYLHGRLVRLSTIGATNRMEAMHSVYLVAADMFQGKSLPAKADKSSNDSFEKFVEKAILARQTVLEQALPDSDLEEIAKLPTSTQHDSTDKLSDPQKDAGSEKAAMLSALWKERRRLAILARSDEALWNMMALEEFVRFLKSLDPANEDYWPKVYEHLGTPFPIEQP